MNDSEMEKVNKLENRVKKLEAKLEELTKRVFKLEEKDQASIGPLTEPTGG